MAGSLTWKTDEFNRQHWEYNYARTVNDAQGKTSDCVLALLHSYSPLSHLKLFYTAISRARYEVQLIVDDVKELTDAIIRQTGEKTRALLDNELKWHVEAVKRYASEVKESTMKKTLKTAVDEFKVGELSQQKKVKDNNLFTECNLKAPKQFSQSKNLEVEL
jgi:CYTH domain-containing protein